MNGFTPVLPTRLRYCGMKMDTYKYNSLYNKRKMTMSNTDKRYQKSETPILDDEDAGRSYKAVQELWVARQPDWQEGVHWEDCDDDVHQRYYAERREQWELRLMTKWNAMPKDRQRELIASVNHTVEALDRMMSVMYDLERPIPESIRKIACKEFEW